MDVGTTPRDRILAVAAVQFARGGFSGAQMAEIAREAGMGVGTLYKHFPSKEALYRAMVDRFLGELFRRTEAALERAGGTLAHALGAYAREAVGCVVCDPDVCRAVARETLGSRVAFRNVIGPELWERIQEHQARVAAFFAGRQGEIRPGLSPEDAAVFFLGTFWAFVEHDLNREAIDSVPGRADLVVSLVLGGMEA